MTENKYDKNSFINSEKHNELLDIKKDMEKVLIELNDLVFDRTNNVKNNILDLSRKLDDIISRFI